MYARVPSRLRWLLSALATAVLLLAVPTGAHAESAARSYQVDLPSEAGNVDPGKVTLNDTDKLTAWVRLPAGYDDQPERRWPVLYLLHGWEDNSDAWLYGRKGAINQILPADFPAIVVMPEGGKGWFINWHNGPRWGDYLFDEVVPAMERQLRILPGRGNHAIGGLSMGGFGAVHAVSAFPSYFGHAMSFSGLLDTQDLAMFGILGLAQFGDGGYNAIFGGPFGAYASTLNPIKTARDFRGSRLSIYYGTPNPWVLLSLDIRARGLATLEIGAQGQAFQFLRALDQAGAPDVFSVNRQRSSHDWPWWRIYLQDAVARGMFREPPIAGAADAKRWEYDTTAQHGNAWGIGYRFSSRPADRVSLIRRGQRLTVIGGSGSVELSGGAADWDASGNGTRTDCRFTVTPPAMVTLPDGC